MCVDHATAISTFMMEIGCVEDMQRKKDLATPYSAYYGAVTTVASIKECRFTVEMLANVGHLPDKNITPDQSTLTGGSCTKLALASAILQRAYGTAAETPMLLTRSRSGSEDASTLDTVWPSASLSGRRASLAWQLQCSCCGRYKAGSPWRAPYSKEPTGRLPRRLCC